MAMLEPPFGLSLETTAKLSDVFRHHSAIEKVLIYGSRAKGNYRPGSDIDITMIGSRLVWNDLQRIEQKIDDLLLPYKVDLSIFHHIDNQELRDHIERWGQQLRL